MTADIIAQSARDRVDSDDADAPSRTRPVSPPSWRFQPKRRDWQNAAHASGGESPAHAAENRPENGNSAAPLGVLARLNAAIAEADGIGADDHPSDNRPATTAKHSPYDMDGQPPATNEDGTAGVTRRRLNGTRGHSIDSQPGNWNGNAKQRPKAPPP